MINQFEFLKKVRDIAAGRQIIVKLQPNEKVERSQKTIAREVELAGVGSRFLAGFVDSIAGGGGIITEVGREFLYSGIMKTGTDM